ncbi:large subunit ribosomal protein L6 [Nitrosomonas cryotolerans]|uniref:Large ribosomal subunit protein uL6 n=1 Tax=Nitrosomonas cryotolerans ATCC 49181 TaxID=1131553 RepID=A0A1N6HK67_9PROT|nr:50S ribosomal protein L6 [Nitrosomonas cryotolerans]SFP64815.1 large subunit ribosomal protein L6 [Nitrosomonas cryotolerans]SIO20126.1 LSU ribosomal protein L6P [Nitrosomonas cryotolerans ATCC 49181]
MSRVSQNPVQIPSNVDIDLSSSEITIKGPLGVLQHKLTSDIKLEINDGVLLVKATNDSKQANAMSGTMRALIANMVQGVVNGFQKKLSLVGVGYRAQTDGYSLNLALGYSHPIVHKMPSGIKAETPSQTEVIIKGIDKQKVGQVAAEIRAYRRPEVYKGKGVRYSDEVIVLKEAKKK